jgi:hypothetical protein
MFRIIIEADGPNSPPSNHVALEAGPFIFGNSSIQRNSDSNEFVHQTVLVRRRKREYVVSH